MKGVAGTKAPAISTLMRGAPADAADQVCLDQTHIRR
jgi:hypothetical protein